MSILKRVVTMTKAAANEMLDKMENPVMMMNQYLRDLEEEIAQAEQGAARQQAQARYLEAKREEQSRQAHYYEEKALQAAAENREAEARTALEAKLLYEQQAEESAKLIELAKQAALELSQRADSLKEERTRLQEKRTELAARASKAAFVPGSQAPDALHGSSAVKGFERIEQKIMEWEAARELAKPTAGGAPSASAVRSERVEEELKRLMKKASNG
ncbi:PspA/IM30 family protein [Paenibacillus thailandensis]|uniref:PspA/IM30 family protein n=1 Tax=Paenibacillus thailandensis TaxID=393250 RepID=A0ABW5QTU6_9BACL